MPSKTQTPLQTQYISPGWLTSKGLNHEARVTFEVPLDHRWLFYSKQNLPKSCFLGEIVASSRRVATRQAKVRWPDEVDLKSTANVGRTQRRLEREAEKQIVSTAYHEAGHAVMARHFRRRILYVSTQPWAFTDVGGYFDPEGHRGPRVTFSSRRSLSRLKNPKYRTQAERWILILLAGPFAEFRHNSRSPWHRGGGSDFSKIDDFILFHVGVADESRDAYRKQLCRRTCRILQSLWNEVEAVAAALVERRELWGDEVDAIIHKARSGHSLLQAA